MIEKMVRLSEGLIGDNWDMENVSISPTLQTGQELKFTGR